MKNIARIAHRLYALLWRVYRKGNKILIHLFLPLLESPASGALELRRFGTDYGGWTVPVNLLNEKSICYCIGVGIDASFDFALANNFGCKVFSFDPTPKAVAYMKKHNREPDKLHFLPIAVWDQDTKLRFYAPANPEETSHSVYDLHGTEEYFEAESRKLSTIMQDLGHQHIDLLKLDIEGAWRRVVANIVDENIDITILCVELDSPVTLPKVRRIILNLKSVGFIFVHYEKDNYLFVKKSFLLPSADDSRSTRSDVLAK